MLDALQKYFSRRQFEDLVSPKRTSALDLTRHSSLVSDKSVVLFFSLSLALSLSPPPCLIVAVTRAAPVVSCETTVKETFGCYFKQLVCVVECFTCLLRVGCIRTAHGRW